MSKRRRLVWAILVPTIMVITVLAVFYVNLNSALNSALSQSLNTFDLVRVEYPSVSPDVVDVNITFSMENPTNYTVEVNAIVLSFWIDDKDIGTVNIEPNQDFPPGEESFFYFFRHVTDEDVLTSISTQTYELTIRGKISASAGDFVVSASRSKDIDHVREVDGIG